MKNKLMNKSLVLLVLLLPFFNCTTDDYDYNEIDSIFYEAINDFEGLTITHLYERNSTEGTSLVLIVDFNSNIEKIDLLDNETGVYYDDCNNLLEESSSYIIDNCQKSLFFYPNSMTKHSVYINLIYFDGTNKEQLIDFDLPRR